MDIGKVACVGAGLIGQGWATLFASKGLEVVLQDQSEDILERALRGIRSNLIFMETHDLTAGGGTDAALKRIRTTTRVSDAAGRADYVQESVPDNYELKRAVFQEMDGAAPPGAILASSASGLMMSDIQKATSRPERCVLVHPMLPAHLIPTVEIVGGKQTSPETVQGAREFMERLGKAPVVLNREVPGYIVNRLQAALLREAIDLVAKGIASPEDVDRAFCKGIGLRDPLVGPFLRMHIAGNGVEDFLENYAQSYRYRWETLETWTSVPPSAVEAVVKGTREMAVVRNKSLEEIRTWRDEMLVKLLDVLKEG